MRLKIIDSNIGLKYDGLDKNKLEGVEIIEGKLILDIFLSKLESINTLKNSIDPPEFINILRTINYTEESLDIEIFYSGSDNLALNYFYTDDNKYLIIVAYGEFQPMRYKLYLEGVWEVI